MQFVFAAVVENLSILAPGFLESIGKNRHRVELVVFINMCRKIANGRSKPIEFHTGEPNGSYAISRKSRGGNRAAFAAATMSQTINRGSSATTRLAIRTHPNASLR